MTKEGKRLPKDILTVKEVESILSLPAIDNAEGMRDRAILEVLYSTGLRRAELAGLTLSSIDSEQGTVMVREGKGRKDRVVPIGERALMWLEKYQHQGRPDLLCGGESAVLFLLADGRPISPDWLTKRVGALVREANIGKRGSCHLFRHTMATLMLENGADTRWIQVMLGHEKLETTQIYTRVSIGALKVVYRATHPAKLARNADSAESECQSIVAENREKLAR